MPLYEFQCEKCQKIFDELATQSDIEEKKVYCPECGSNEVKKRISAASLGGSSYSSASASCGTGGFS